MALIKRNIIRGAIETTCAGVVGYIFSMPIIFGLGWYFVPEFRNHETLHSPGGLLSLAITAAILLIVLFTLLFASFLYLHRSFDWHLEDGCLVRRTKNRFLFAKDLRIDIREIRSCRCRRDLPFIGTQWGVVLYLKATEGYFVRTITKKEPLVRYHVGPLTRLDRDALMATISAAQSNAQSAP